MHCSKLQITDLQRLLERGDTHLNHPLLRKEKLGIKNKTD